MPAATRSSPIEFDSGRCRVVTAAIGLLLAGLIARLIHIQFLSHDDLEATAIKQHGRVERLRARPGDVLDVRGRPLATSVETASVFLDPGAIPVEKHGDVAESLALVLGLDADELRARLDQHIRRRFLWVKRRISDDEARGVRDLKWPSHWVGLQSELRRFYPQGKLATHVVGLRDIDGQARDGIETVFDALLRGKPGTRVAAHDGRGKTLAFLDPLTRWPEAGSSIVLTIDSAIQMFAEEALDRVVAQWKPAHATAIVMDPRSGEILAMANRPTYDPEDPSAAHSDAWVNRAISDSYEPGSTFKPFIVAAALDWNVIKPEDEIDCHFGVYRMGPRLLHSHHRNGLLTVPDVVVKSDNIGMAIIGERMTNPGLYRAVQSFGFGRATGIELPGESAGAVRPLRQWTPFYSTGSVPMGQELAVTPLQLIAAFSALANDGELLRPRVVRAIVGPDGRQLHVFDRPEVVGRPVRPESASFMIDPILTCVVDRGTGRRAQLPGYGVFGKTGTAQKQVGGAGYARGRHVSSFIAGAPASDPSVVALVVVDDPSKGKEHYGGEVAAPATAEILRRTLTYLQVPTDREVVAMPERRERIVYSD